MKKSGKKAGRPKTDSAKRQSAGARVRLTESEKEQVQLAVDNDMVSLSEWVRDAIKKKLKRRAK